MLPGMDGLEVCKEIQRDGVDAGAHADGEDRGGGQGGGVRRRRRRLPHEAVQPAGARVPREGDPPAHRADAGAAGPTDRIDRDGLWSSIRSRRRVTVDGDEIGLTPLEFEILLTLGARARRRPVAAIS